MGTKMKTLDNKNARISDYSKNRELVASSPWHLK